MNKVPIRKLIVIFIFICWAIFASRMVIFQANYLLDKFPILCFMTQEEKYDLMDGDFYHFMRFCNERLPTDCDVLFLNSAKGYLKNYQPDKIWKIKEYHSQRACYLLYPRKVYPFSQYLPNSEGLVRRPLILPKTIKYTIVYQNGLNNYKLPIYCIYKPNKFILQGSVTKEALLVH